jgi:peptidoglycan L-alanyl-D-glutamate endopeptidase CwlK
LNHIRYEIIRPLSYTTKKYIKIILEGNDSFTQIDSAIGDCLAGAGVDGEHFFKVCVFLLAVALYFLLACFISWVALFPAGRACIVQAIASAGAQLRRSAGHLVRRKQQRTQSLALNVNSSVQRFASWVRRHYLIGLAALAVICTPALLALLAGDRNMLGGFDASTREMNVQVAQLLIGEQLAPPSTLPPLVFATQAVIELRPMLGSASRNWTLLNADYAQRLLQAFKIMKEQHGYEMAILEGYRSPERQTMLAGMGSNVTNAAAFQSWHQYGLAADCAFLRDGKLLISEKDPWAMRGYRLYGEVAESVGLTWGGRWKMMDFGHTELRLPGVMKR